MPLVGNLCINTSGVSCPVYEGLGGTPQIGAIEPRELFSLIGREGNMCAIYFMAPSGGMKRGYLHTPTDRVTDFISNHPYQTGIRVPGDNSTYIAFYMRQQMTLYNADKSVCGSVAAGKRVLCKSSMIDVDYPYLKGINYAEKRTGGWDRMDDGVNTYGYVDSGLRSSTSANNIALYGNW